MTPLETLRGLTLPAMREQVKELGDDVKEFVAELVVAAGGKKEKKEGKKGKGKKVIDTMAKKEWYVVRAPNQFKERNVCRTLVSRTSGLKIASDGLKGRVFEANLGDLNKNEDQGFRKMRLRVEDVQGDKCITLFYGMDTTRDKDRKSVV